MDIDIHKGHRTRLRERVQSEGLDNFKDYQVLEYALSFVIPYKDTNPIAHRLIEQFGSLDMVLEADIEDIAKVDGMGQVSAQYLNSIIKIYNFYEKEKINKVSTISSPKEAYNYVSKLYVGKTIEELYLICLKANNKIAKTEKISIGNGTEAKVNIRKITDSISRNKVNNVIISHNHPSGKPNPSTDDDKFTKALVTSLALNDCYLVDHIIVGDNEFYSYRQSGKIDNYKNEIMFLLTNKIIAQDQMPYEVNYD